MDGLLGLSADVLSGGRPAPPAQTGRVQVRMLRRYQAGACRIVGPRPTLAQIVQVAEQVKMLLPAGRAGIEGPARCQLHARNDEVQFMVPGVAVPHPEDVALIRLQPREGQPLEVIHDALLLLRRHRVVRMPGQHSGGEPPSRVQRVDESAGGGYVATQNIRRMFLTTRIITPDKVARGCVAAAPSVRKDLHQHAPSPAPDGTELRNKCSSFSMPASAKTTSTVCSFPFQVLAQRAT